MKRTNIHRGFTEKAECHARLLQILGGKRRACRQGNLSTYKAMAAHEAAPLVKQVHRCALAFGHSTALAAKFRHDFAGVHSAHQGMTVLSVGGEDVIIRNFAASA